MSMDNSATYEITMNTLFSSLMPIMRYMQDDKIFEVYVNSDDGIVRIDGYEGREETGVYMSASQRRQVVDNVAALTGQVTSEDSHPWLDAEIPSNKYFYKCRFHANLPSICSAPSFNIRKHPTRIFTLEDYVERKIFTKRQYEVVIKAIHDKKNIIAAGGTKSGKTTLLNAFLAEIAKLPDRVVIIEDTPELQCSSKDVQYMKTNAHVDMAILLRHALRMTPDRIVVGEVRGGEALALLDAWSTGHGGGCATVHSNSAKDTITRIENMISRVSVSPQKQTIAQAVDMVVYLKYVGYKRIVENILTINGYDPEKNRISVEYVE